MRDNELDKNDGVNERGEADEDGDNDDSRQSLDGDTDESTASDSGEDDESNDAKDEYEVGPNSHKAITFGFSGVIATKEKNYISRLD